MINRFLLLFFFLNFYSINSKIVIDFEIPGRKSSDWIFAQISKNKIIKEIRKKGHRLILSDDFLTFEKASYDENLVSITFAINNDSSHYHFTMKLINEYHYTIFFPDHEFEDGEDIDVESIENFDAINLGSVQKEQMCILKNKKM